MIGFVGLYSILSCLCFHYERLCCYAHVLGPHVILAFFGSIVITASYIHPFTSIFDVIFVRIVNKVGQQ